jgi:ketosteroid isomerase-like protein
MREPGEHQTAEAGLYDDLEATVAVASEAIEHRAAVPELCGLGQGRAGETAWAAGTRVRADRAGLNPYGGTFRGPDAFVGWFTHELWRWFDEFTSSPEAVIDGGDLIVVPVNVKARVKNGKALDVHNLWVYEVNDGKLTKARVYADTAALLDTVEGFIPAQERQVRTTAE